MNRFLLSKIIFPTSNIAVTSLAILSIFFINQDSPFLPIRWIFGTFFLFFAPGFALVATLFVNDKQLSNIERFTLSVGLSFIIVSLTMSLLNLLWKISLYYISTCLSTIIFALSFVAIYHRAKRYRDEYKTKIKANTGNEEALGKVDIHKAEHPLNFILLSGVILALLFFVIHPLFTSYTNYIYEFAMNSNALDMILLLFGVLISIFILRSRLKGSSILCYVLIALTFIIAIKARILPALVSTGIGGDVGIDNWDSIGHTISVIGSGHYSETEPYFLIYQDGQMLQSPNPLAPGYFYLMAAVSMLIGIEPLQIPRFVFLISSLQPIFMFALVKRKTNDNVKAIFSAFLLAGGSLLSDHIRFTNGSTSPVEIVGLTLVLIGVYLLTLEQTRLIRALELFLILSLLNFHLVTAIIYLSIIFVYSSGRIISLNHIKSLYYEIKKKDKLAIGVIVLFSLLVVPISMFWYHTTTNPLSNLSIHYTERFTFFNYTRPTEGRESLYQVINQHIYMDIREEGIYLLLLFFGLYYSIKKKDKIFTSWILSIAFIGLLLQFINPNISPLSYASPVLAFLNQAASAAGGVAIVSNFVHKPLHNIRKSLNKSNVKKMFVPILIVFIVLYLAISPVFIRSQSPDDLYLRGNPEIFGYPRIPPEQARNAIEVYLNASNWALENFNEDAVLLVNSSIKTIFDPFISHPINIFRHTGVTMLVGININSTDIEIILNAYEHVYAVNAGEFPYTLNETIVEVRYVSTKGEVSILKLSKNEG